MARTMERTVSWSSNSMGTKGMAQQLQEARGVFGQSHHGMAHRLSQAPDEMVSLTLTPRSKKRVSWQPNVVDNEPLEKKCYEKEFFFSQDIWG